MRALVTVWRFSAFQAVLVSVVRAVPESDAVDDTLLATRQGDFPQPFGREAVDSWHNALAPGTVLVSSAPGVPVDSGLVV